MAAESSVEKSFARWCKREGLERHKLVLRVGRGWPDNAVFLPDNRVCWIEFKSPIGKTDPQQDLIHRRLRKAGHEVFVCRTLEEAKNAVAQVSAGSKGLST